MGDDLRVEAERLRRVAVQAIALLASGDELAARALVATILGAGPQHATAACLVWVDMAYLLGMGFYPGHSARIELSRDGALVEPEDLPAEMAPHLWAARLITATANDDQETVRALLKAVIHRHADPAQVVDYVKTLAGCGGYRGAGRRAGRQPPQAGRPDGRQVGCCSAGQQRRA